MHVTQPSLTCQEQHLEWIHLLVMVSRNSWLLSTSPSTGPPVAAGAFGDWCSLPEVKHVSTPFANTEHAIC